MPLARSERVRDEPAVRRDPVLMVYKMTPSSGQLNDATALVELPALPRMMHDWVQDEDIINFILPFSLAESERYRRKFSLGDSSVCSLLVYVRADKRPKLRLAAETPIAMPLPKSVLHEQYISR